MPIQVFKNNNHCAEPLEIVCPFLSPELHWIKRLSNRTDLLSAANNKGRLLFRCHIFHEREQNRDEAAGGKTVFYNRSGRCQGVLEKRGSEYRK